MELKCKRRLVSLEQSVSAAYMASLTPFVSHGPQSMLRRTHTGLFAGAQG